MNQWINDHRATMFVTTQRNTGDLCPITQMQVTCLVYKSIYSEGFQQSYKELAHDSPKHPLKEAATIIKANKKNIEFTWISSCLCKIQHHSDSLLCQFLLGEPWYCDCTELQLIVLSPGLDLTRILLLRWNKVSEIKSFQIEKLKRECTYWDSEWLKDSGGKILTWKHIKLLSPVSVFIVHS